MDHLGRYVSAVTYLYPSSGVQRTTWRLFRWTWTTERKLARTR